MPAQNCHSFNQDTGMARTFLRSHKTEVGQHAGAGENADDPLTASSRSIASADSESRKGVQSYNSTKRFEVSQRAVGGC